ncbi:MAG TPA: DsbA family protein [Candidatus Binatia bacterium]|jgi:2-hydroxychromene-2-carboxylate isomerase
MTVRVAIDFGCAASYLAIAPTRALQARLEVAFDWLPFPRVTTSRPRVAVPGGDRSARHFRMRSEYRANDLRRYAQSRGLDLGDADRSVDTATASLGLLWQRRFVPSDAGEYVARVFDRIWRENADPGLVFVEECLGASAAGFREYVKDEGPREAEAIREQLASEGVWNVPAYLVGGELFIGRQHLPAVEFSLRGMGSR